MYSVKHRLSLLTIIIAVLSLNTGCGNKGSLYLPNPSAETPKEKIVAPNKKTVQP